MSRSDPRGNQGASGAKCFPGTGITAIWRRLDASPRLWKCAGFGCGGRPPGGCGALLTCCLLAGGRNRTAVVLNWLWAYLTYRRGTRLITRNTMDA